MIDVFVSQRVLLSAFGVDITWYGLMYVVSFGLAFWLLPKLQKFRSLSLSKEDWLYVLAMSALGVVVGGRLGYVVLYEPGYFMQHTEEVFAIWDGGMSSHGGFIGVALVLWFVSSQLNTSFWKLLDTIVVPASIGFALGRLGNFINQELFVPAEAAFLAVIGNLVVAGLCYWVLQDKRKDGLVLAVFLMGYAVQRFITEFFREDPFGGVGNLTRGQMYTVVVFLIGLGFWRFMESKQWISKG